MFRRPASRPSSPRRAAGGNLSTLRSDSMRSGEPLSLRHLESVQSWVESLTAGQSEQRLSEHSFANLYLFRHVHDYQLATSVSLPAISGKTYDGVPHLMPLCRMDNEMTAALLAQALPGTCLYPLAAWQIEHLDEHRFNWTDSSSDADYLYPAPQFTTYPGKRLRKKRLQMQQLLARHTVRAQPLSSILTSPAAAVLAEWMHDKGHARGTADEVPCLEALHLGSRLGLTGYLYHVDDQPGGFLLTENLSQDTCVVRFAKGLDRFKGIYPFMFHHLACQHSSHVRWLNFEQDLGLESFRRAKRSLQPSSLLRKFRVTLR